MKEQVLCGDCAFFKRKKWHKALNGKEEDQLGGTCTVLAMALSLSNSALWKNEELYVYENFGCSLGRVEEVQK
jgi:hypothetical protein